MTFSTQNNFVLCTAFFVGSTSFSLSFTVQKTLFGFWNAFRASQTSFFLLFTVQKSLFGFWNAFRTSQASFFQCIHNSNVISCSKLCHLASLVVILPLFFITSTLFPVQRYVFRNTNQFLPFTQKDRHICKQMRRSSLYPHIKLLTIN